MASLKTLNEKLQMATNILEEAVKEIRELPFEPTKEKIRTIGKAIVYILRIQRQIYNQCPELQPIDAEVPKPDPDLTKVEKKIVDKLVHEEIQEIDNILLSHAHYNWRKVAMLVGLTMSDLRNRERGILYVFCVQRVRELVEEGRLESQGNLQFMRFSEVRLPGSSR